MAELFGSHLIIAAIKFPPFADYKVGQEELSFQSGFEVEFLHTLTKVYNFSYSIIDCKHIWGKKLPNNSWIGIIGELAAKRADIGLSFISVTYERSLDVLYSYPHTISQVTFITPGAQPGKNFDYMYKAFDFWTWLSLLFTLFVYVLLVCHRFNCDDLKFIWKIIEIFLQHSFKLTMITQRYLRILIISLIFACFFLSNHYINIMYALSISPSTSTTIDTIEQLYQAQLENQLNVYEINGSAYLKLLKESNIKTYRAIESRINVVQNNQEVWQRVADLSEPSGCVSSKMVLDYYGYKYMKDSFHIPEQSVESTFFFDLVSIAYREDFKHKEDFDKIFSWIRDSGLYTRWINYYKTGVTQNTKKSAIGDNYFNLDFQYFMPLINFAYKLNILSFIIALIEFIISLLILKNNLNL